MERIIFILIGGIIAVLGIVYFFQLLILRLTGLQKKAEVTAVKESERGVYVHTLRFDFKGKMVERDDKTGYSQPFSKGDVKKIICSKKSPDKFEYVEALNKNIVVSGIMIVMALLIVLRFAFFVEDL